MDISLLSSMYGAITTARAPHWSRSGRYVVLCRARLPTLFERDFSYKERTLIASCQYPSFLSSSCAGSSICQKAIRKVPSSFEETEYFFSGASLEDERPDTSETSSSNTEDESLLRIQGVSTDTAALHSTQPSERQESTLSASVDSKTAIEEDFKAAQDVQVKVTEAQSFEQEFSLSESGKWSTVKLSSGNSPLDVIGQVVSKLGIRPESIRNFSLTAFIKNIGKKPPREDLRFTASMYETKSGVSNLHQWTATELTLQHTQMVRIARDLLYLVYAFSLFGAVRILEAVLATFATRPIVWRKLLEAMNALDPITIATLSWGLRKPVVGMIEVDPFDLEEVNNLKARFWKELHTFFERQWKVIATLGVARLMSLIATNLPSAEAITKHFKFLWDFMMALPIF